MDQIPQYDQNSEEKLDLIFENAVATGDFKKILDFLRNIRSLIDLSLFLYFLERRKEYFANSIISYDIFQTLTSFFNLDNNVLHAFCFRIINIFARNVQPELPILRYIINGCKSLNYEKRLAAKKAAIEICKNFDYFSFQIIRSIGLPDIIDIIPHLTRSTAVVHKTIRLINHNLHNQNQYLMQFISSVIEFCKKIDYFPTSTFKKMMILLNENVSNKDVLIPVLKTLRQTKTFLLPYQQQEILNFCCANLMNEPETPQNEAQENMEKVPFLRLLSCLMITDDSLVNVQINTAQVAFAYSETLPHNPQSAQIITEYMNRFKDDLTNPKLFRRAINAIIPMQFDMPTEYHAELSTIFKGLISLTPEHQDAIGDFLLEVSEEASGCYIELGSVSNNMTKKLKLGFARAYLLIGMEIEDDKSSNPLDLGEVGNIAFMLGKYPEALSFYMKKEGDLFYDAMVAFTQGEIEFLKCNYTKALMFYQQSFYAFTVLGHMYILQQIISGVKTRISSLLVQINLLTQIPNVDYQEVLDGVESYLHYARLLPKSVVLAPNIDKSSSIAAQSFVEQFDRFHEALQHNEVNDIIKILQEFHPVPRAMFNRDFPINITNITPLIPKQFIDKQSEVYVGVAYKITIENENYKDASITYQIYSNTDNLLPPVKLPSSGEAEICEGVLLANQSDVNINQYLMPVSVWFRASFKENPSVTYNIASSTLRLPILKGNRTENRNGYVRSDIFYME